MDESDSKRIEVGSLEASRCPHFSGLQSWDRYPRGNTLYHDTQYKGILLNIFRVTIISRC